MKPWFIQISLSKQAAGKHMLLDSAFWKSYTFKLADHNI